MTSSFERSQDRTTTAPVDLQGIEAGWTVYDSLGRPVGNVTDVAGDLLRIDGRPEGFDFFEVPTDAIRSVGDSEVRLSLETQQISGLTPVARPSRTPDIDEVMAEETAPTPGAAPDKPRAPVAAPEDVETAASRAESRREALDGSSYTASGTPVGLGSNTPVGDEPGGYRAWEAEAERPDWVGYAKWLAPIGIGAASAGAYVWWRNRQARRSRLARLTRALSAAGGSMGPVLDAAREDRRTWWLASLAALPLAYFLRPWDKSTVERAREAAAERAPSGDWRQRLPSSMPGAPTRPALDTVVEAVLDAVEPPPLWTAAIPVAAAGLAAAWFATRGRKPLPRQRSTKRLGQIMTRNVQVIRPEASLFEAASMMKQLNVGVLPVCDGRRLQGMLTDRDVVVRAVADSRDPQLAAVRDAMTAEVVYAYDDDSVEHGAELMRKHQIRRLPIVDRQKDLVGIVSLGDLAVDTGDDRLSGATLERVSEPARPRR